MATLYELAGSPTEKDIANHPYGYRYALAEPDPEEVAAHLGSSFDRATIGLLQLREMGEHLLSQEPLETAHVALLMGSFIGSIRTSAACALYAAESWGEELRGALGINVDAKIPADSGLSPENVAILLQMTKSPLRSHLKTAAFHFFMVRVGAVVLARAKGEPSERLEDLGYAVARMMSMALQPVELLESK